MNRRALEFGVAAPCRAADQAAKAWALLLHGTFLRRRRARDADVVSVPD